MFSGPGLTRVESQRRHVCGCDFPELRRVEASHSEDRAGIDGLSRRPGRVFARCDGLELPKLRPAVDLDQQHSGEVEGRPGLRDGAFGRGE